MPEIVKNKESSNKKLIILIASLAILILAIILFVKINNKDVNLEVYTNTPKASMELGSTGFVEEGVKIEEVNPAALENPVRPLDLAIPNDIFSTSGTITAIYGNYIIVRGIGTNFDDQVKRDLTVSIDGNTFINGGNDDFQTVLKVGDEISIESSYNIHGKTEFLAKYIKVFVAK